MNHHLLNFLYVIKQIKTAEMQSKFYHSNHFIENWFSTVDIHVFYVMFNLCTSDFQIYCLFNICHKDLNYIMHLAADVWFCMLSYYRYKK